MSQTEARFGLAQIVAWLAAAVVATGSIAAFAFNNFESKDHASERAISIEKRLDRIEAKIDVLIKLER